MLQFYTECKCENKSSFILLSTANENSYLWFSKAITSHIRYFNHEVIVKAREV